MTLHYSDLLTRENVLGISEKYGFTADPLVEKFIMCFEIHKHITQEIQCTTRGGMCVPFHQSGFEVRRMSRDIDLMSSHSVDEFELVMSSIDGSVDELRCQRIVPKNPFPIENLVSYRIHYNSCLGMPAHVKVDTFCGADINVNTQRISSGSRILDFETRQDMTILSRGALIADKVTSLAIGTVGISTDMLTEIVKQIYDIAMLLRQANEGDLAAVYDTYQILTKFKVDCFKRNPPYTVSDVCASMVHSLDSFIPLNTNALVTPDLLNRYDSFRGSYLTGLHPYEKSDHIADVVLVSLLVRSIQRHLNSKSPGENGYLDALLKNLDRLGRVDKDGARVLRETYLNNISGRLISRKMIKNSPLEHVYLVKELSSLY